jgi:hypothetical protein
MKFWGDDGGNRRLGTWCWQDWRQVDCSQYEDMTLGQASCEERDAEGMVVCGLVSVPLLVRAVLRYALIAEHALLMQSVEPL